MNEMAHSRAFEIRGNDAEGCTDKLGSSFVFSGTATFIGLSVKKISQKGAEGFCTYAVRMTLCHSIKALTCDAGKRSRSRESFFGGCENRTDSVLRRPSELFPSALQPGLRKRFP